jgi:hypothetical protein
MSQAHEGIPGSEFVMMTGCLHMSPAGRPEATIGLIRGELAGSGP